MIDDAELQPAVATAFIALADLLVVSSDLQWQTPSLCEGWRVCEVVAHMTMPARYTDEEFMTELERHAFDFTSLSNEVARRDAIVPAAALVADLRSDSLHHWTPPGGGFRGALNHVVIHSLDVTVPLGTSRLTSDDTIRTVLDDLTQGAGHVHFGTQIEGHQLAATDLDWSYGSGPALRGAAGDLALAICGRSVGEGRLDGPPLGRVEPDQKK